MNYVTTTSLFKNNRMEKTTGMCSKKSCPTTALKQF